ncbi:hypothetical protein [Sphingorhabdus sp.]|uniref:hypothetical protein n=1 Tax=Sphingorhabdus sp. TaxID=1902408 RepID=UPI0035944562
MSWTAFFAFVYYAEVSGGLAIERLVYLASMWATPMLFLAVGWLLTMRHSSAESVRFGNVALSLRQESMALERRMRTVNEEISMARQFLAQNALELESVGKRSSQHLIEAAGILAEALADSDEKAKTLETVSNAATTNLEQLRKHLPVVTSAAKDVTNQIGSAGSNAQLQIKLLISGLERISEAGISTREYIDQVGSRADVVFEKLHKISRESAATLDLASTESEKRAVVSAELLSGAAENMVQKVGSTLNNLDHFVQESAEKIGKNISEVEKSLSGLSQQSEEERGRIFAIIGEVEKHLGLSSARITEIDQAATDQTAKLAFAVSALSESSRAVGADLNNNQHITQSLMELSGRLLAALNAVNEEISNKIPASIAMMDTNFSAAAEQLSVASNSAGELDSLSEALIDKTNILGSLIHDQRENVEKIMAESDAHFVARHEQVETLTAALAETRTVLNAVTEEAQSKLNDSLNGLRETTKKAASDSREIIDAELVHVADRLIEQNQLSLAKAIDGQIKSMNDLVQTAVERNLSLSESSTIALTSQIKELDELANNLEKRVTESRNSFEGIDDDSFSRRMVLLTESLNSTSIDVAKILSNEVTDTAWAAYLKGDRGVFTRRAVRLLDAGETRTIATHYGQDAEFREHVNRYIHDFEAMMRVLLSTRDGNAICVTLLSSDVGKLYVALAQAIERLRN